jgi:L-threonylcarbamoyladenylate synthase
MRVMKRYTVSVREPDPSTIAEVAAIVRGGGVVAFPTDTLYGLAVDPRTDEAVERLFDVKGREAGVAVPLIAADIDQAREAGRFGDIELRLARAFWPGPLTIVVAASASVSRRVLGRGNTVGIRVPAHEVATALCRSAAACLTATSANPSGKPAPASAGDIDPALIARLDAVLDAGPGRGGPPSTIVAIVSGRPQLVRAGAIAWDRVLESLE